MDRSNVSVGGGGTQKGSVATVAHQTAHWTFVASAVTRWPPDRREGGGGFLPNSPSEKEAVLPEISRGASHVTSLIQVERKCGAAGQDKQLRTSGAEGCPEAALKVRQRCRGYFEL